MVCCLSYLEPCLNKHWSTSTNLPRWRYSSSTILQTQSPWTSQNSKIIVHCPQWRKECWPLPWSETTWLHSYHQWAASQTFSPIWVRQASYTSIEETAVTHTCRKAIRTLTSRSFWREIWPSRSRDSWVYHPHYYKTGTDRARWSISIRHWAIGWTRRRWVNSIMMMAWVFTCTRQKWPATLIRPLEIHSVWRLIDASRVRC